jgi:uncharacterized protein YkwD
MSRPTARYVASLLAACAALCAASASRADALSVVQLLREGGCGGIVPAAGPLEPNASLNRTAALWAAGFPLPVALARSGNSELRATGLRVAGPDRSMIALIRRSGCRTIASRQLHDIGVYQSGWDAWVVVAFPDAAMPAPPLVPLSEQAFAARALQLVNESRARGTRCGRHYFPPAPPLRLSSVLASVASGHALDMAQHGYFDHEDLRGESPADRVRAVGYRETLVGENIAYGTETIDETVKGWLDSPDHCENIMDPRFAEMGIADAAGATSRRGLYWVQLLADPRELPSRSE